MSQARTQAVFWNFVGITEWYDLLATTTKDHPLSIAVNDTPSNVWDHDLWIYGVVFEVMKVSN